MRGKQKAWLEEAPRRGIIDGPLARFILDESGRGRHLSEDAHLDGQLLLILFQVEIVQVWDIPHFNALVVNVFFYLLHLSLAVDGHWAGSKSPILDIISLLVKVQEIIQPVVPLSPIGYEIAPLAALHG